LNNNQHIINGSLISLDIVATDSNSAIEKLSSLLNRTGRLTSLEEFLSDINKRENAITTEVGWGVAIPHARSRAVKQASICFGRSGGFKWNKTSIEETRLVFMLATPNSIEDKKYLKMLASLACMLLEADFRNACLKAQSKQQIISIVNDAIKLETK